MGNKKQKKRQNPPPNKQKTNKKTYTSNRFLFNRFVRETISFLHIERNERNKTKNKSEHKSLEINKTKTKQTNTKTKQTNKNQKKTNQNTNPWKSIKQKTKKKDKTPPQTNKKQTKKTNKNIHQQSIPFQQICSGNH